MSKEGFFGPAAFFHHRHPPTGWTDFDGPLRPRASTSTQLRGRRREPVVGARGAAPTPHCRIRFWRLRRQHGAPRAQRRRRRAAVRPRRRAATSTATSATSRFAAGDYVVLPRGTMWRSSRAAPLDVLLIEATNAQLHAAGQGPGRPPRDLRSGDARHADASTTRSSPSRPTTAVAGRGQAAQRAVAASPIRSIRSTRSAGTASSRVGAPQRARHPAADEPPLPPAAVGAHDLPAPTASSSAPSRRGRSRPIRARSRCRSSTTTTTTTRCIFYHAGDFFSRDNIHPGMMTLPSRRLHARPASRRR